jgi:heptaprenyl diphosphate synthase
MERIDSTVNKTLLNEIQESELNFANITKQNLVLDEKATKDVFMKDEIKALNYINEKGPDSFLYKFEKEWDNVLDSLNCKYCKAEQLRTGNRLRPQLVCWSYLLRDGQNYISNEKEILTVSVCYELIHKASIILDDFIDDDLYRHNRPSFHNEFSAKEAAIFASVLMYFSIQKSYELRESLQKPFQWQLTETIRTMGMGALSELDTEKQSHDMNWAIKILEDETMPLIRNTLTSATILNNEVSKSNCQLHQLLSTVGHECAYIFQILNDMEPFTSSSMIVEHKGDLHFDIEKNRKNYIFSYLLSKITKQEKEILFSSESIDKNCMLQLIDSYNVIKSIIDIVDDKYDLVSQALTKYSNNNDDSVIFNAFQQYINALYCFCRKRANISS